MNDNKTMQLAIAFNKIVELAAAMKVRNISRLSECWVVKIDEQWTIAVNGHSYEVGRVPPFSAYIEYNGWPAGIISPSGGVIAAGEMANEDSFIAAIDTRIARERKECPDDER